MPAVHDQGICVRQWDFSETSQTVSIFGRSLGLVRGLAKGARRERGAFGGGIDLLSRGEFGAITKPSRELCTLTEWDLLELFPRLRTSLAANRAAFYMADLVGRMLQPEDPHPHLYDQFMVALRALGDSRTPDEPVPDGAGALLLFQWSILCETGYRPTIEHDGQKEVLEFAAHAGGVVASSTPTTGACWKVRRSTIDCLQTVDTNSPCLVDVTIKDRANRLLAAYISHVLGNEPPTMAPLFQRVSP